MTVKKTILLCSHDAELNSKVNYSCKENSIQHVTVKNGREIPVIFDSLNIALLIIDSKVQNPCVIDILYLLSSLKCTIPTLVLGDCEEKVLLSISRIGNSKNLTVYGIHVNQFNQQMLHDILTQIDKKNRTVDPEAITVALEKKQFTMHYQPKIAIRDGCLIGAEALIRWNRPNNGLVSPDEFIPIAEESGLIIPMTYWVIREAFSQQAAWKKKKIHVNIAINLSASILTDLILPNELGKIAKEFRINPQAISFEITEAAAMQRPEIVLEVLTRIRLRGFSLSIDDFGTGYSSLVELQQLPFTELKIDKSFITNLATNKADQHIVRSIINLGQNMGLSLVAEGVETQEAMDILSKLGCNTLQGYLISKPLSVPDFVNWYKSNIDEHGVFKEYRNLT